MSAIFLISLSRCLGVISVALLFGLSPELFHPFQPCTDSFPDHLPIAIHRKPILAAIGKRIVMVCLLHRPEVLIRLCGIQI